MSAHHSFLQGNYCLKWCLGCISPNQYTIWGGTEYRVLKLTTNRKCLACLIMKRALDILLLICARWLFHVRNSSIYMPTNFTYFTFAGLFGSFVSSGLGWGMSMSFRGFLDSLFFSDVALPINRLPRPIPLRNLSIWNTEIVKHLLYHYDMLLLHTWVHHDIFDTNHEGITIHIYTIFRSDMELVLAITVFPWLNINQESLWYIYIYDILEWYVTLSITVPPWLNTNHGVIMIYIFTIFCSDIKLALGITVPIGLNTNHGVILACVHCIPIAFLKWVLCKLLKCSATIYGKNCLVKYRYNIFVALWPPLVIYCTTLIFYG